MNNKVYRKKNGVKEVDKCYLCNNKAMLKCKLCKGNICNNCRSLLDKEKCYKCDIIEVDKI